MNANDLIDLLAAKHEKDVFIPECKNGPSYGGEVRRFDAWVMAKSWAKPKVTIYEVKVSRSDFLNDNKWPHYLDYCNEFYFACPHGMIKPDEVPRDAGLVWASKQGKKIITKAKAAKRKVKIPEDVFRYILMSRVIIQRYDINNPNFRAEYWAKWLDDKNWRRSIGQKASRRIAEECRRLQSENRNLEAKINTYENLKELLLSKGIDLNQRCGWTVERELAQYFDSAKRFSNEIQGAINALEMIKAHAGLTND